MKPYKAILVTSLAIVVAVVFTHHLDSAQNEDVDASHEAAFQQRVNELDKFYYGFCQEAKFDGYAKLKSYNNLCGDL